MCHACALGKSHRKCVRKATVNPRAKRFGAKVHVDLQEIPKSFYGNQCALHCVDDHSRCVWLRFLKCKSQAAEQLTDLIRLFYSHNRSVWEVFQVLR